MARIQLRAQRFNAIIIDTVLPDADGLELCVRIRRRGSRVPMIMLCDLAIESDVVRALDAGANDYVKKPLRLAERSARLRGCAPPSAIWCASRRFRLAAPLTDGIGTLYVLANRDSSLAKVGLTRTSIPFARADHRRLLRLDSIP
jgi:CheY-like chemotaxis protein